MKTLSAPTGCTTKNLYCPECEGRVEFTDFENCTGADHEGNPSYSWVSGYFCMENEECEHYNEPIDPAHYRYEP